MLRREESINTESNQDHDARSAAIRHSTKQKEDVILNAKNLAVVRAALTFWDEEMGSASKAIYEHYLHSKDREVIVNAQDVTAARTYFNQVNLKFAVMNRNKGAVTSGELVDDSGELACEQGQQIVSVLVP